MKRMTMGVLAAAAIAFAGGTAHAGRQPAAAHVSHGASLLARVNVAASEFKFVLSKKSAKRGLVVFRVTNTGAIPHDFKISGRKTRLLSHGQSATLRVTFLRKGHYPYQCTVPGHAAAGMKGVFTIT
jgi:plastocyanin